MCVPSGAELSEALMAFQRLTGEDRCSIPRKTVDKEHTPLLPRPHLEVQITRPSSDIKHLALKQRSYMMTRAGVRFVWRNPICLAKSSNYSLPVLLPRVS